MQTKGQIQEKIAEMSHAVLEYLKEETDRLMQSGAIDLESHEDNYRLPKALLVVALRNCAEQYTPRSWDKTGKKEIAALSHF